MYIRRNDQRPATKPYNNNALFNCVVVILLLLLSRLSVNMNVCEPCVQKQYDGQHERFGSRMQNVRNDPFRESVYSIQYTLHTISGRLKRSAVGSNNQLMYLCAIQKRVELLQANSSSLCVFYVFLFMCIWMDGIVYLRSNVLSAVFICFVCLLISANNKAFICSLCFMPAESVATRCYKPFKPCMRNMVYSYRYNVQTVRTQFIWYLKVCACYAAHSCFNVVDVQLRSVRYFFFGQFSAILFFCFCSFMNIIYCFILSELIK